MKNTIYIGSPDDPSYTFDNGSIFSNRIEQKVALVGQNLSYDTMTVTVADAYDNVVNLYRFRSSDGQEIVSTSSQTYCVDVRSGLSASGLLDLDYGTPVWYYNEDVLVGKFYLDNVTREGKNLYQLECVSAIGVLDKLQHGGGLFQQSTFGAVLAHILASGLHGTGSPVIGYEIDDDVASIPVSGWLPYATKRENLYQLVFAYGVNIIKNIDGNPRFTFVYTAPENPSAIQEEFIFLEGGVTYEKPYSGVSVTEHTYTAVPDAGEVTLLDNVNGTTLASEEIWFDQAPIIVSTLRASSGLTIVSATENSAVLSGNGTLTGVPYTHTKRIVAKANENATGDKVIDVTECTMVNLVNSNNLLNRLYAFYCPEDKIKRIRGSFKQTAERCGRAYTFKNKFEEEEVAFLSSMDLTASTFLKANAEFYADYVPAGQAGLYTHVGIFGPTWNEEYEDWVYTGTWTVPEGVTEIKVVLIGGGTGGSSGWPGENGDDAYAYTYVEEGDDISSMWYGAEGGDGGKGGDGGSPGRVKVLSIQNVTPGMRCNYMLGMGGKGGAATGFKPDTVARLRTALENEDPNADYTDAEIEAMIAQEDTDWNGSPNVGREGTATLFYLNKYDEDTGRWSNVVYTNTIDGSYTPTGGVYEPITGEFYAINGRKGIPGGKGGARRVEIGELFNWVTDGEDVVGEDGTVYHGGTTGTALTHADGLPEAKLTIYGGNGAGAAVGLDSRATDANGELLYPHMNGGSDQTTSWEVTEYGV